MMRIGGLRADNSRTAERLVRTDQAAQRRWVNAAIDEYESPLLRYALRFAADEHAARDLVQFVFLKLCDQSPAELDGRLRPWLYAVCRNRARELGRKERRMETLTPAAETTQVGHEPSPYEAAERHDAEECLQQAINDLPPELQEVLDLWSNGLCYREISDIVDREPGHIRVQVHRAIQKLRQHPKVKSLMVDGTTIV